MEKTKEVEIDGVVYVPKGTERTDAKNKDGLPYVIVRTFSAGVFAGYLKSRKGTEVVLLNARRLWYWKGAASLSELAISGVKNPSDCKFPCEVGQITLTESIEIIKATIEAQDSISSVKIWTA